MDHHYRTLVAVLLATLATCALAQVSFTLSSPDLADGAFAAEQVYDGFGCTGGNVSPALAWEGAPEGTQSFALTVYDPDAPTGSGWWHWILIDIPADVTSLPKNAGAADAGEAPSSAVQGPNDFGGRGYGGPCPPEGAGPHDYVFTLFALDVATLDVPEGATAALIGFNLNAHALGQATMTIPFTR